MAPAPRRSFGLGVFAVLLLAIAGPGQVRAACVRSCKSELAACKRTRCAGERGHDRRRCVADCRGSTGCDKRVGTLAYVVTTCHEQGTSLIGTQELRIRRNDCDPVVAMRFANPDLVQDPIGLCGLVAKNRSGNLSPIAGVFQRLAVAADGSGVIFEVTNEFELVGKTALSEEQQGFFYVRADGTGLRRLGPPSRDPIWRLGTGLGHGGLVAGVAVGIWTQLNTRPDGSMIVYTDLGPGSDGFETQQVFTLDVRTGERRQLTSFPRPPSPLSNSPRILWPGFVGDQVYFDHIVDAAGKDWRFGHVNLDGTGFGETVEIPPTSDVPANGVAGRVDHTLKLSSGRVVVDERNVDAPSERPDIFQGLGQRELFADIGKNVVQLTNFHLFDTELMNVRSLNDLTDVSGRRAPAPDILFMASADPLGTNPFLNCNIFRISALGTHLRQLTSFSTGALSMAGCGSGFFGQTPGCGIEYMEPGIRPASTQIFYSDCDPFGTNPNGSQAFLVDFAGRLRQLTRTAGAQTAPDGTIDVEIPGPMARGGFAPF